MTPDPTSAPAARVLLIEDDEHFREGVLGTLRLAGFEVQAFGRAGAALRTLPAAAHELVLTDLRLPDMDGLEVLAQCRAFDPELPVAVMTGHADIDTAVRAIREGAYDFVEKPFGRDRLVTLVQRAVRQLRLARENRGLRSTLAAGTGLAEVLCGDSAAMRALRELILRIAPTPVDVLVCGETGTGKELVARALHDFSGRRGPFVAINCAALPEALIESELFGHESGAFTGAARSRTGRIEHAHQGTLFLDEIEAMPAALQAKLLRVLQEREVQRLGANQATPVDVRVVAASNDDLEPLIAQGRFRADLYYRLNVVNLRLVPLRDRREDVAGLFEHFIRGAALRFSRPVPEMAPGLPEALLAHAWPGNVRELKSAAERHVLGLPALPAAPVEAGRSLQATLEALEGLLLEDALRRCKGKVEAVCQELDLSPATFYRKLKAHGLRDS
ncbi:MAG TPA: sigma-54 dependent transcriptional regulator [Albitalea sp.]|uniref:sigma-54-dependent transcriptional regulator n=1 Tax=Piscinibacter sp. TaxID=1903157 RepID=UPI002ED22361